MACNRSASFFRRLLCGGVWSFSAFLLASSWISLFSFSSSSSWGQSVIRDDEIETYLREGASSIFRAAGLNADSVKIYLVADSSVNAFVAGGQRIFIHSGMIEAARTPNQLIGVIAHETGHIAAGHLTAMQGEIDSASNAEVMGALAAMAVIVGGIAGDRPELAQAGAGIAYGSRGTAIRRFLTRQRLNEATADQAALELLDSSGQSARGMLEFFEELSRWDSGSPGPLAPYVRTHPAPRERLNFLRAGAEESKWFSSVDPPELVVRHRMAQAKLRGYLDPERASREYADERGLDALYARAIAAAQLGRLREALVLSDSLISAMPSNPWFHELKGQSLFENGKARESLPSLARAVELEPEAALARILFAQAILESRGSPQAAADQLRLAARRENETPFLHRLLATSYARMGRIPMADLETAESALLAGDYELALDKAQQARKSLTKGSPEWVRAGDVITEAGNSQ